MVLVVAAKDKYSLEGRRKKKNTVNLAKLADTTSLLDHLLLVKDTSLTTTAIAHAEYPFIGRDRKEHRSRVTMRACLYSLSPPCIFNLDLQGQKGSPFSGFFNLLAEVPPVQW